MASKKAEKAEKPAKEKKPGKKLPALPWGTILWGLLSLLLTAGAATTVLDLTKLSDAESLRANVERQRVLIDPVTGVATLGSADAAKPETHAATEGAAPADAPKSEGAEAPHAAEMTDAHAAEAAHTTPAAPEHAQAATAESGAAPTAPTTPATPHAQAAAEAATTTPGAPGMQPLRVAPLSNGIPVVTRSGQSLIAAPAPEITEQMGDLLIPRRNEKDATPSKLYARHFTRPEGKNLLAFVVMDAGLDAQSLPLLVSLPAEVSVAFSPYARSLTPMIEALRNDGHEAWGTLPMMSSRYPKDDPGPLGLIGNMPKEEILRRLYNVMGSTIGAVGVVLPPEETLSTQREMFGFVMDELATRGMFVLSTHPTRGIRQLTEKKDQIPMVARADLLLDANPDKAVIESKLAGILKEAEKSPNYVVALSASPQTVEILKSWLARTALPSRVVLAPLSAVYAPIEKPPEPVAAEPDAHGSAPSAHGEEKPAESSGH